MMHFCCVWSMCAPDEGPFVICIARIYDVKDCYEMLANQLDLPLLPNSLDDYWLVWDDALWGDALLYNPETGSAMILAEVLEIIEE